jgi:hypothetical protein
VRVTRSPGGSSPRERNCEVKRGSPPTSPDLARTDNPRRGSSACRRRYARRRRLKDDVDDNDDDDDAYDEDVQREDRNTCARLASKLTGWCKLRTDLRGWSHCLPTIRVPSPRPSSLPRLQRVRDLPSGPYKAPRNQDDPLPFRTFGSSSNRSISKRQIRSSFS